MKINYSLVSRSLIALLFVTAGVQKLMSFEATTGFISRLTGTSGMVAVILTALVIIVEIPVALAFAWGYKICTTGIILSSFTALATLLAHRDFSQGQNMVMALKNIAIIGGIIAAVMQCCCGKCPMGKKCAECEHHKK